MMADNDLSDNYNAQNQLNTGSVYGGYTHVGNIIYNTDTYRNIELQNISHAILEVNRANPSQTLQEICTTINLKVKENNVELPFCFPEGFNNWIKENKILLYGVSGCGKSRSMIEILKDKVEDFRNVYVIHLRNSSTKQAKHTESLESLIKRIRNDDIVIWDNFPEGLFNEIISFGILEIITKNVQNMIVSLNPYYILRYEDVITKIPELQVYKIKYAKESITEILELYGLKIQSFQEIYDRFIKHDLQQISETLWLKEPTPSCIGLYYQQFLKAINAKTININETAAS